MGYERDNLILYGVCFFILLVHNDITLSFLAH